MRSIVHFIASLTVLASLTGCPSDDKGGKNAVAPPAPPVEQDRGGCKYDFNERRYRYENGDSCSYDDYYNPNACYNYFYDVRYGRYYNDHGDPVDCENEYFDYSNVIPYYNYNYTLGYPYWGCPIGYAQVPVGFGYYVCAVDPNYSSSLNLTWWFWLNL